MRGRLTRFQERQPCGGVTPLPLLMASATAADAAAAATRVASEGDILIDCLVLCGRKERTRDGRRRVAGRVVQGGCEGRQVGLSSASS